jgi:hypothetical protein
MNKSSDPCRLPRRAFLASAATVTTFTVLRPSTAGDFIVEQSIHSLDVGTWIINADLATLPL